MRPLLAVARCLPRRLLRRCFGFRGARRLRLLLGLWIREITSSAQLGRYVWNRLREIWKRSRLEMLWILGARAGWALVVECWQAVLALERLLDVAMLVQPLALAHRCRPSLELLLMLLLQLRRFSTLGYSAKSRISRNWHLLGLLAELPHGHRGGFSLLLSLLAPSLH